MGQSQLMKYLYLFYKQTIKSQMSQAVIFFSLDKYILAIFVGLLETISEKIILNSALQFQKIFQVSTKQQSAISISPDVLIERGTCIKGLFWLWPPLEPKTESCFSPISSYWFIRRIAQV